MKQIAKSADGSKKNIKYRKWQIFLIHMSECPFKYKYNLPGTFNDVRFSFFEKRFLQYFVDTKAEEVLWIATFDW